MSKNINFLNCLWGGINLILIFLVKYLNSMYLSFYGYILNQLQYSWLHVISHLYRKVIYKIKIISIKMTWRNFQYVKIYEYFICIFFKIVTVSIFKITTDVYYIPVPIFRFTGCNLKQTAKPKHFQTLIELALNICLSKGVKEGERKKKWTYRK